MQTSVQGLMTPQAARTTDPLHSTRHVHARDIMLCLATTSCYPRLSSQKSLKYLPDGGVYEDCLSCPGELQGVANMKTLLKWVPPTSPYLQER